MTQSHKLTLKCSYCQSASCFVTDRDGKEYCGAHSFIGELKAEIWREERVKIPKTDNVTYTILLKPGSIYGERYKCLTFNYFLDSLNWFHDDVLLGYEVEYA